MEFKTLRKRARSEGELERLRPQCDLAALIYALNNYTEWFDLVRREPSSGGASKLGVRTALEHRPSFIQISSSKVGEEPWRVRARLMSQARDVAMGQDVLELLPGILQELCVFWSAVHAAAGWDTAYDTWTGDTILLAGSDDNQTAFWPEI
jgi:hypothetical protein